jgi:hypothetical protein
MNKEVKYEKLEVCGMIDNIINPKVEEDKKGNFK